LLERPILKVSDYSVTNKKVCGVVKDYLYAPMQYPVLPLYFQVYTDNLQKNFPAQYLYVRYRPGHKEDVLTHIRRITAEVDSDEVSDDHKYVELETIIELFNRPEKVIFTLFSLLAWLCILISSFGIYALVSLSTEQRKKEMAIRKINGATPKHILQIFIREYLILTVVGNALALSAGYLLMKRWLETYAYHIDMNAWSLILVFALTSAIVTGSIYRQVAKAAKANPAETIKAE
jgi:ABC-type antimicrobial peptide transport system permease subunit